MILCVIQARMSSSRLFGKVLLPVIGRPILALQVERLRQSSMLDKLAIATSTEMLDNSLEQLAQQLDLYCFRGNLEDVLDRYYQATKHFNHVEHVVRITGDCPLIDPEIIDKVVQLHLDTNSDYTSNTLLPSYPDGCDVEVMKLSALHTCWSNAKLMSEREHVTLYIHNNKHLFQVTNCANKNDLSSLRWTLDEKEDFEFVSEVYNALYKKNNCFRMNDVVELIRHEPALLNINNKYKRNEGLENTLSKDSEVAYHGKN